MVGIARDNLGGIVLKSSDQGLVGEELIVFLGATELSDVEIHTTFE